VRGIGKQCRSSNTKTAPDPLNAEQRRGIFDRFQPSSSRFVKAQYSPQDIQLHFSG
jgi:hypothetical protein